MALEDNTDEGNDFHIEIDSIGSPAPKKDVCFWYATIVQKSPEESGRNNCKCFKCPGISSKCRYNPSQYMPYKYYEKSVGIV